MLVKYSGSEINFCSNSWTASTLSSKLNSFSCCIAHEVDGAGANSLSLINVAIALLLFNNDSNILPKPYVLCASVEESSFRFDIQHYCESIREALVACESAPPSSPVVLAHIIYYVRLSDCTIAHRSFPPRAIGQHFVNMCWRIARTIVLSL